MVKITIKYEDEAELRVIQLSDSNINNEKEFVDWVLNSMWNDCYMDADLKSSYYNSNEWLCDSYFDLFYKVYNVFDWYNGNGYWENTEHSYVLIEVI